MPKKMKSLKTLLSESFHFYNKNSLSLLKVAAVAFIPLIIIDRLFFMRVNFDGVPGAYLAQIPIYIKGRAFSFEEFAILALLAFSVTGVIAILYQITVLKMIDKANRRKSLNILQTFKEACGTIGSYLVVFALVSFWVSLGSIFFVVPGVVILFMYSFSLWALIIDGKKGKEALKYSRRLVKGNIKKYVGNVLVMLAITLILYFAVIMILEFSFAVHGACNYTIGSFSGELLQDISGILFSIYPVVFSYFLYNELKTQI